MIKVQIIKLEMPFKKKSDTDIYSIGEDNPIGIFLFKGIVKKEKYNKNIDIRIIIKFRNFFLLSILKSFSTKISFLSKFFSPDFIFYINKPIRDPDNPPTIK